MQRAYCKAIIMPRKMDRESPKVNDVHTEAKLAISSPKLAKNGHYVLIGAR